MIATVSTGRPGTGMKSFASVLGAEEIEAVVDFVRSTFIERKDINTYYHIPENGWPRHERYRDAYPFALGELALDTPDEELGEEQRRGKRLFMSSCITCHDRARLNDDRTLWQPRAVSYPRAGYSHRAAADGDARYADAQGADASSVDSQDADAHGVDTQSRATPYARHDRAPVLAGGGERERLGERIFQQNCAFCHAADGTGRNWIGSFLEPAPRDLTDADAMAALDGGRLRDAIAEGVPGTAMPAWRTVLSAGEIDAVAAYVESVFIPRGQASR
jgi:cytochrome c oxidase cbb3-type subunit 3